jgi:RimJ/RimL family protein N-acetyltransferase
MDPSTDGPGKSRRKKLDRRTTGGFALVVTMSVGSIKLVPLTAAVVRSRLDSDDFSATVVGLKRPVRFGAEWPGDLLPVFPMFAGALSGNEAVLGQYIIVDTDRSLAVGALGILGQVEHESVEIGYGINTSEHGRGFATAAVGLLVQGLLNRTVVPARLTEITAKTAVDNRASERVLEKNGFVRTGTDHNEEDGDLITWAVRAAR